MIEPHYFKRETMFGLARKSIQGLVLFLRTLTKRLAAATSLYLPAFALANLGKKNQSYLGHIIQDSQEPRQYSISCCHSCNKLLLKLVTWTSRLLCFNFECPYHRFLKSILTSIGKLSICNQPLSWVITCVTFFIR